MTRLDSPTSRSLRCRLLSYPLLKLRSRLGSKLVLLLLATGLGASPALAQSISAVKMNDSGQTVTELQQKLLDLGYYNGEITGFYGSMTKEAVMRFQQDMGLTADGVVGPATATALQNPSSSSSNQNSSSAPQPLVRSGDSGAQISELQKRLTDLGYYNASISGSFDQATEEAVIRFQRDNGLLGDGIVGAATETALRQPARQSAEQSAGQLPQANSAVGSTGSSAQSNSSPANLLRLGDTGAAVSELQTRLTNLGFYRGAITGNYDAATQASVIALQQSRGLVPDGIAGPQVAGVLGLTNAGAPAGGNGQSWQQLQQARSEAQQAKTQADQAQREAEQARLEAEQARLVLSQNLQEGRYSVAELQRYLRSKGYNPGEVNGTLTSETRSAIIEAQQRYGLSDTDLFGSTLP
jgi:peptidoglycan hydrolase-like protein with peptidoglycan-binding domain